MAKRRASALCLLLLLAGLAHASFSPFRVETRDFPPPVQRDASRTDTTLYEVNFITGFDGWTSQDLTDQGSTWHMSSFNSFDGSWNWWSASVDVGGYLDHTLLFLELPPLNLSATTSPQLTFNLFWALESPAGAPAPYDGWDACHVEVKMGAGPWQLLTPSTPAYTVSNAFAFGEIFGHGIRAGWAGLGNTWRNAVCDLTPYRSTATRIRFAFASDDYTSFPDDDALTGMQLDNIQVADGALILLQNNADGVDTPGPTLHYSGVPAAGDHWAVSTTFHSSPFSVHCQVANQAVPISNVIYSPPIFLPANYTMLIDFWTKVDLLDYDGDGDSSLDDYFLLEYSLDGFVWRSLFYDYYDTETGSGQWYHFMDGGGHGRSTNVSFLGGNLVFFRFRVQTDNNHDGGTGTGFFVDDFRVVGSPLLPNDVGVTEFRLPYPRTLGRPIPGTATFQNFGLNQAQDVQWSLYMDNLPTALGGTFSLEQHQHVDVAFSLTPDATSLHFPQIRLMTPDGYAPNDRLNLPSYIVRPTGVLELANDYGWDVTNPEFLHTTGSGDALGLGYAQRFQPPQMGPSMGYALDSLRLRFASFNIPPEDASAWRLKVWSGLPVNGTLLHQSDHNYAPSYAGGDASEDWIGVSVAGLLEPFTQPFWIEVLPLELKSFQTPGDPRPVPNLTLVPRTWEEVSSYRVVNNALIPLNNFQFNFHCFGHEELIDSLPDGGARPATARLAGAWPNPFNPMTTISYQLDRPGRASLSVFDLQGRLVARLMDGPVAAGEHRVVFNGAAMASGHYLVELAVDGARIGAEKVLLVK
ncbi:MAG: hypothetical protein Q8O14_08250 [bacterium]|jgi:hypothetical protein|nr:hypothetical protein [bacterium]